MSWRLVETGANNGAMNMAIDEAILTARSKGLVPPTVRFYRWQPPSISLGYFQAADREVDLEACRRAGVDVVRRITGGRAVLHDRELTYSLITTENDPHVQGNILQSYLAISRGLQEGLRHLGVEADIVESRERRQASQERQQASQGRQQASQERQQASQGRQQASQESPDGHVRHLRQLRHTTAACFDAPSWYELTVAGRKIVGSAQTRRLGCLLQHGSVILNFDIPRFFDLLNIPDREVKKRLIRAFDKKACSLTDILHREPSYREAVEAMTAGLARGLQIELKKGELTPFEQELAVSLAREKYALLSC